MKSVRRILVIEDDPKTGAALEMYLRHGGYRAELRGDLAVAGWTHANPTIDLVDHFPVANLGSRFLRAHVVTFDLQNQRMALGK